MIAQTFLWCVGRLDRSAVQPRLCLLEGFHEICFARQAGFCLEQLVQPVGRLTCFVQLMLQP